MKLSELLKAKGITLEAAPLSLAQKVVKPFKSAGKWMKANPVKTTAIGAGAVGAGLGVRGALKSQEKKVDKLNLKTARVKAKMEAVGTIGGILAKKAAKAAQVAKPPATVMGDFKKGGDALVRGLNKGADKVAKGVETAGKVAKYGTVAAGALGTGYVGARALTPNSKKVGQAQKRLDMAKAKS